MKKFLSLAAVLLVVFLAYSVFTRPMTIAQLHPELTLDKCTGISGYYGIGSAVDDIKFSFDKESEEFQTLYTLFYEQTYHRSLRDILPRGTRTHRTEPDDVRWKVEFNFEGVEDAEGNGHSGPLLQFDNWFNEEFDIYFFGERFSCRVNNLDAFAKEVFNIIQQ